METWHRAVLSRFVLLIVVCIRFGFGIGFRYYISNYMIAEGFEFEFRVSSSSCEFWVGTTDTTVHGVRYRMQVG